MPKETGVSLKDLFAAEVASLRREIAASVAPILVRLDAEDRSSASLQALMNSSVSALDDKIDDLRQRLDRDEGKSSGFSSTLATVLIAAAVLISLASLSVNFVNGRPGASAPRQDRTVLAPQR